MSSMTQLLGEIHYAFIMRSIEVRQKLNLASDKMHTKYHKKLIQKLFPRIVIGLRS